MTRSSQRPRRRLRVLIVDDHALMRQAVRALIEAEGDIEVIAESEAAFSSVETARRLRPDVVLMDVILRGLDGIEATRRIKEVVPTVGVVMFSGHTNAHLLRAALDAGALGYVSKGSSGLEVRLAIREAAAGRKHLSPELAAKLASPAMPPTTPPSRAADPAVALTARENELVRLVAEGFTTAQIAGRFALSEKTVEADRSRVMKKLGIADVTGLTRYAVRKGLVSECED